MEQRFLEKLTLTKQKKTGREKDGYSPDDDLIDDADEEEDGNDDGELGSDLDEEELDDDKEVEEAGEF